VYVAIPRYRLVILAAPEVLLGKLSPRFNFPEQPGTYYEYYKFRRVPGVAVSRYRLVILAATGVLLGKLSPRYNFPEAGTFLSRLQTSKTTRFLQNMLTCHHVVGSEHCRTV
jgi:hypothetical protein